MQWYRGNWKPTPSEQPGQVKVTDMGFEFVSDMRMSPAIFKDVMLWMKRNGEEYEKAFREIKTRPTDMTKPPLDKTLCG